VIHSVGDALEAVPAGDRTDVIAVQLDLRDEHEDSRRSEVVVAWNTEGHLRDMQRRSSKEHREDCEFNRLTWACPEADRVGGDELGSRLLTGWLVERGLWYDGDSDWDVDLAIGDALFEVVVEAVSELHARGRLRQVLDHDIPVFVTGVDSSAEYLEDINQRANPARFHELLDRWSAKSAY
jgi:hypothetical protein